MWSYNAMYCAVYNSTQLCQMPKEIIWIQFCLLLFIGFRPMQSEIFRLINIWNLGLKTLLQFTSNFWYYQVDVYEYQYYSLLEMIHHPPETYPWRKRCLCMNPHDQEHHRVDTHTFTPGYHEGHIHDWKGGMGHLANASSPRTETGGWYSQVV